MTQSDTQAVEWFRKAAEQGDADAQNYLGWMYDKGRGVSQSDAQATTWYRKAAEQGNSISQYNLGLNYEIGQGVTKNPQQAYFWYYISSRLGYEDSVKRMKKFAESGWILGPEISDADRYSIEQNADEYIQKMGWK